MMRQALRLDMSISGRSKYSEKTVKSNKKLLTNQHDRCSDMKNKRYVGISKEIIMNRLATSKEVILAASWVLI